jgi:hypothetical protein
VLRYQRLTLVSFGSMVVKRVLDMNGVLKTFAADEKNTYKAG